MSEYGYGYQGPPRDYDYLEEEREAELENYISRRVKARVIKTSNQTVASTATATVNWNSTAEYDTAGLWVPSQSFVIPEGGDGDYRISAKLTGWDSGGVCSLSADPYLFWFNISLLINGTLVDFTGVPLTPNFWIGFGAVSTEESLRMGDTVTVQVGNPSACSVQIRGGSEFNNFAIRRLL